MSTDFATTDVRATLRAMPVLRVTRDTTDAEAIEAVRLFGTLNETMLGVARFSGATPWEIHPDADELLYVVDGTVEVTLLTDDGPVQRTLGTGCVCVVPRNLWHRQHAHGTVALLFATAAGTTASSWADDPRASS